MLIAMHENHHVESGGVKSPTLRDDVGTSPYLHKLTPSQLLNIFVFALSLGSNVYSVAGPKDTYGAPNVSLTSGNGVREIWRGMERWMVIGEL